MDFIDTVIGPDANRHIDFLTIHPRTRKTPSRQPINVEALQILTSKYGDRLPILVHAGQSDQVGVVVFALLQRRESVPVDLDQAPAKSFGVGAVVNACEAGDRRRDVRLALHH